MLKQFVRKQARMMVLKHSAFKQKTQNIAICLKQMHSNATIIQNCVFYVHFKIVAE